MKLLRLATVAALSTTILAGGVTAFAEESRNVITDNDVSFTANSEEEVVIQPPITEPEVGPIDPTPRGQTGPLTIAYAPRTFNFGENTISTQNRAYSMIAEEQPLADGSGTVPYVSFAQIQDTRGTHDGWNLSVSLTDFISEVSGSALTGAQIEFMQPEIVYNQGEGDQTLAPMAHSNQEDSLFLNAGGQSINVMTATATQGAGTSSVIWGNQEDLMAQMEEDGDVLNHAIKLHVPGSTAQDAAAYTATMTWTLSSVTDEDGETISNP